MGIINILVALSIPYSLQVSATSTPRIRTLTPADLAPFTTTTSTPPSAHLPPKTARSINGPDDRHLWPTLQYPSTTIGRFVRSDGNFCTASLIGPRHVLTAAHCATPPTALAGVFQPSYFSTERFPNSTIASIVLAPAPDPPECLYQTDWAILVLSERLGDAHGYLGTKLFNPDTQLNRPIFSHAAYPNDKDPPGQKLYRQWGIEVWDSNGCDPYGPLLTYADVVSGHSGGPLWFEEKGGEGAWVVGVASGFNASVSIFAAGKGLVAGVAYMRATYP